MFFYYFCIFFILTLFYCYVIVFDMNKFKITYYFSHSVSTALVVIALWNVMDNNLPYKIMFACMGVALEFSKTWLADLVIRQQLTNKLMYFVSTILCILLICLSLLSTIGSISTIAVDGATTNINKNIKMKSLQREEKILMNQIAILEKETSNLGGDFYTKRATNQAKMTELSDKLSANGHNQATVNDVNNSNFFDNISNSVGFNKKLITLFYIIGFSLGLELTVILTLVASNGIVEQAPKNKKDIQYAIMDTVIQNKLHDLDLAILSKGGYTQNTDALLLLMEQGLVRKDKGKWVINYGEEQTKK